MRRLIIILFAIIATNSIAAGQNIIVGDKLPNIKHGTWLMDAAPDSTPYSCILFYHSKSGICQDALKSVRQLCKEYTKMFSLIIVTQENHDDVGATLTSLLSNQTGVLFDDNGHIHKILGIKFAPFCVIYNNDKVVVWCGNAQSLNLDILRDIVTEKNKI